MFHIVFMIDVLHRKMQLSKLNCMELKVILNPFFQRRVSFFRNTMQYTDIPMYYICNDTTSYGVRMCKTLDFDVESGHHACSI